MYDVLRAVCSVDVGCLYYHHDQQHYYNYYQFCIIILVKVSFIFMNENTYLNALLIIRLLKQIVSFSLSFQNDLWAVWSLFFLLSIRTLSLEELSSSFPPFPFSCSHAAFPVGKVKYMFFIFMYNLLIFGDDKDKLQKKMGCWAKRHHCLTQVWHLLGAVVKV